MFDNDQVSALQAGRLEFPMLDFSANKCKCVKDPMASIHLKTCQPQLQYPSGMTLLPLSDYYTSPLLQITDHFGKCKYQYPRHSFTLSDVF